MTESNIECCRCIYLFNNIDRMRPRQNKTKTQEHQAMITEFFSEAAKKEFEVLYVVIAIIRS